MAQRKIGWKTREIFRNQIKNYDLDELENNVHVLHDEFGRRHDLVMNYPNGKVMVYDITRSRIAAEMFNEVCLAKFRTEPAYNLRPRNLNIKY